jgi:exoribonuclease-2
LQDAAAQALQRRRHERGALSLRTVEATPVFDGEQLRDVAVEAPNRAKALIEDLMIAANSATAAFLSDRRAPSLRRVVRQPKRWPRIVALAAETGVALPPEPDARALEAWLTRQRAADDEHFADLSMTIVKLLGSGEYVVEMPGDGSIGHFGLAVADYTHATAPNRRFADLITQRILKAALAGEPAPYATARLTALARHCTEREDAANAVERQVRKSATALLFGDRIGATFDALVTGVSSKETWVRVTTPPIEGRLEPDGDGVDVGQQLRVRLVSTDVTRGFIDFVRA